MSRRRIPPLTAAFFLLAFPVVLVVGCSKHKGEVSASSTRPVAAIDPRIQQFEAQRAAGAEADAQRRAAATAAKTQR